MTSQELRQILADGPALSARAFEVLHSISCIVNDPDSHEVGHDLVLRLLAQRDHLGGYEQIVDALVRSVGLFPYLDPDLLGVRDAIAFEFHRPEGMAEDFVFHREQAEVFRRLLNGDSVILSAPTSFGKSRIVDALIASAKYRNLAVIVPTLSLIDETRRRLAQFTDDYKLVTHLSQHPAERNIFIMTAERAVAYEKFPPIDFFVIDEFYKLGDTSRDESRTVSLNHAFYKMRKMGGQFYLLGPNIQQIPEGLERAYRCHFYPTRYATVASDQTLVAGKGDDVARLVALCRELHEPTLIFCRSPARVNEVARALIEIPGHPDAGILERAAAWADDNYHPEWVFGAALRRGIAIHHGKLPRSLAQFSVRMFNELQARFLVCTSTLIEGVNTKAKNVIVFDNKIARKNIDYFTFSNIKGRSGRMFEHFIGHVYLFNEPPAIELPFVDFPVFSQEPSTPESLLIQIGDDDLKPAAKERIKKYAEQDILPLTVLQANSTIEPASQIALARYLAADPQRWQPLLSWTRTPTTDQFSATCDLIWTFLVGNASGRGGVFSARQLAFKTWQLRRVTDTNERVRQELRPGKYSARSPDEAVERVLDFERTWASFDLPRYLVALSRIQSVVLQNHGNLVGNFSWFASEIESLFTTPVVAALDEFGIPYQVGMRLDESVRSAETLDQALAVLKGGGGGTEALDAFERELIADAVQYLPKARRRVG